MEGLFVLEEKIKTLVALVKNLKKQQDILLQENNSLKIENDALKAENTNLIENNAQLIAQMKSIESSVLLETDHIQELKEERSVTRSVLDDLIKSIDSLVENENQQQ